MTKYIVKNCPSLDDVLDVNTSNTVYKNHCLNKDCACKDRTDCPIKQVVELCMNYPEKPESSLSNRILQTLQVEEVE